MKYMGSKHRHAKDILPIILKDRKDGQLFVEPFCGGCNITDKVSGNRIANDIDEDLICLWRAVSNGWTPPSLITEDDYNALRNSNDASPLKGYAAFALSFGGKKFGGWRRDKAGILKGSQEDLKNTLTQNRRSINDALKQFPKLLGVDFRLGSYLDLVIPDGSIVYCDPPYRGATGYSSKFDHDIFWNWVREKSLKNNVYVSEYDAPEDFICVWEKSVNSSLTKNTGSKKNTEKLFTWEAK